MEHSPYKHSLAANASNLTTTAAEAYIHACHIEAENSNKLETGMDIFSSFLF